MKKFLRFWAPVVVWCALIFIVSAIPHLRTDLGWWDLLLRKIAHAAEYAVLAGLFWRGLANSTGFARSALGLFTMGFCVLHAVADEYHQSFVPGRAAAAADVFIDAAGAAACCFYRWKQK